MKRTPINERMLPVYTHGEELVNMITHIAGAVFGLIALVLCVVFAAIRGNTRGVIAGAIYGTMMIFLYTISAVYHGLSPKHSHAKKILQVLDHCSIYALIAGCYVPVLLTRMMDVNPVTGCILSGVVVIGTALGVTFTAIDFHKYRLLSNLCYFLIGWCIVFGLPTLLKAFGAEFFLWMLAGGLAYSFGTVFYATGKKKPYHHSVFHVFILLGTALQFVGIFKFCIL